MNVNDYRNYIIPRLGGEEESCTPASTLTHSNPSWANAPTGVLYQDTIQVNGDSPLDFVVSISPYNDITVIKISENQWFLEGTPNGDGSWQVDFAVANCGETIAGNPQFVGSYTITEI